MVGGLVRAALGWTGWLPPTGPKFTDPTRVTDFQEVLVKGVTEQPFAVLSTVEGAFRGQRTTAQLWLFGDFSQLAAAIDPPGNAELSPLCKQGGMTGAQVRGTTILAAGHFTFYRKAANLPMDTFPGGYAELEAPALRYRIPTVHSLDPAVPKGRLVPSERLHFSAVPHAQYSAESAEEALQLALIQPALLADTTRGIGEGFTPLSLMIKSTGTTEESTGRAGVIAYTSFSRSAYSPVPRRAG